MADNFSVLLAELKAQNESARDIFAALTPRRTLEKYQGLFAKNFEQQSLSLSEFNKLWEQLLEADKTCREFVNSYTSSRVSNVATEERHSFYELAQQTADAIKQMQERVLQEATAANDPAINNRLQVLLGHETASVSSVDAIWYSSVDALKKNLEELNDQNIDEFVNKIEALFNQLLQAYQVYDNFVSSRSAQYQADKEAFNKLCQQLVVPFIQNLHYSTELRCRLAEKMTQAAAALGDATLSKHYATSENERYLFGTITSPLGVETTEKYIHIYYWPQKGMGSIFGHTALEFSDGRRTAYLSHGQGANGASAFSSYEQDCTLSDKKPIVISLPCKDVDFEKMFDRYQAIRQSDSRYNLRNNNCVDVAADVLQAGEVLPAGKYKFGLVASTPRNFMTVMTSYSRHQLREKLIQEIAAVTKEPVNQLQEVKDLTSELLAIEINRLKNDLQKKQGTASPKGLKIQALEDLQLDIQKLNSSAEIQARIDQTLKADNHLFADWELKKLGRNKGALFNETREQLKAICKAFGNVKVVAASQEEIAKNFEPIIDGPHR